MTTWNVTNGQSIQAAIAGAADGDTIVVGAGTYAENLTIDKAVTIEGANAGIAGTGGRVSETIIMGTTTVTAAGPVTIDGVEVFNTSTAGTQFIGVSVHTAGDVTIENSVFFSPAANGSNEDRAINLDTTAQGHIVVANNLITGDATGKFSTASWHRGIWSDGAASQLDVTGNTFQNVRSGMNLDGYDDAHTNISGNTFSNGGTAISIGTPVTSSITGIHDNTFKDIADDFNLKNVDAAHPQTFDADATHNIAVASGSDAVGVLHVLGTRGADTLAGTAGADVLDAADLPDGIQDGANNTLQGLGGDDTLIGSNGSDTFDGGGGNDTIIGGAGSDTAVYAAAIDPANISDDGSHFVVGAGGSEGTDTLSGIEKVAGQGGPNILLVGHGGYSSIQAAVDAAADGDIIEIAAGTWTEDVAVHGKAITIDGVGLDDVVLNGKITVDGTLNGAFKVTDLDIDATGKDYGVFVSANSDGFGGSVTLDGVSIAHAQNNGFAYIRAGNGSSPTQGDTIGSVSILNSQFSDNATANSGGSGRGDVLLFGYNQDLTLTNVDISSPGAFAQKAIQMRGIQDAGDLAGVGPYDQAGDVAINNLTISGAYGQDVIGFYRIAAFDSFTGTNNSVNVTRSVNANPNGTLEPWAVINMDEVGGPADLSSFFSSASNMASANGSAPAEPSWIATLQGLSGADSIVGTSGNDVLVGRDGADVLNGSAGADTMLGGAGNDTYAVDNAGDVVTETLSNGTDMVQSSVSFTLGANVENLNLTDGATSTQIFDDMALGPIADGENGWKFVGPGNRDQAVVDLGGGNHAFRISSDPASGDFGGPYSPALSVAAGESGLSPYQGQSIAFDFKAVSPTADGSRVEIDFANANGTDRSNFLLIESADTGLRIAVNEPLRTVAGDWANNDFTAFTGNRMVVSGVDQSVQHHLEMRLTYVDGQDNDRIDIYLDGAFIGSTTTFENYRDFHLGQDHDTAASANLTSRVLFRAGNGGQPQDGAGGQNQGFDFDNLTTSVYNNASGTGNDDANVITGNSGDNVLSGLGGNDTLQGNAGNDTLDGGQGIDTAVYAGTLAQQPRGEAGHWVVDGSAIGAGTDTLSNIEIIQHAGGRYLLVGNDGFADASAAAAAATRPGDTLVFATAPGGTVSIDLGGSDDTHELTVAGDDPVDITTGAGDNQITVGGGNNQITTGDGNNHITTGGGDNHITTGGGNNVIVTGGSGNNTITTGSGNNAITTGGGNDSITTGDGQDTIHTGDGNDVVHAGGGDDTVVGGQGGGNDFYDGGSGVNTVEYSSATHSITVDLNEIDRSGDLIIGAALGEVLAGGGLSAGTPVGYAQGADIGMDVLLNVQNVVGGSGADTIIGNSLNNILDGRAGSDMMMGGLGNDTYVVDNIGDVAVESVNEGIDTVNASTHYRLAANVENLTLTGTGDLQAYGNSEANTLTGNAGNNLLAGGAGADIMIGGAGNDVYFVDDPGDQAVENPGEGADAVLSTAHFRLSANVDALVLQGNADLQGYGNGDANLMYGNAGANILNGEGGADAMFGGAGNDAYFVDNAGDGVFENFGEGTDVVFSTAHFRLSDNVEALVLQGTADLQGYGNSEANLIYGNSGNNILNAESGADAMVGGAGNDVYFVDNAGDAVFENAGEGTDIVFSTAHFRLSEDVETLVLQGSSDLQGYGNSQANTLYGNVGNNLLNGGGGADVMRGGAGNDVYFVDNAGDAVIENSGEGNDTVFAAVDYSLGANVDNLILQEGSGALQGTGNSGANAIFGNSDDNTLDGGAGHDKLTGGLGNDVFVFRAGEADEDIVVDFDGQGPAAGDSLEFVGYSADATFTNVDATHWQIAYNGGSSVETITFVNGAAPELSDWHFV